MYNETFRIRAANQLIIFTCDVKIIEEICTNPKVGKSFTYKFYEDFLGNGTLISSGERWLKFRRLVTPSFHFQILEDFVRVFEEQSKFLIKNLEASNGATINVPPLMEAYAMDVIFETSMGLKSGAQTNDLDTAEYRHACEE